MERLDTHLGALARVAGGKRMLPRPEKPRARAQVRRKQRLFVPFPVASAGARLVVAQRIGVEPRHAVSPSHQQLQLPIGNLGGFPELRVPGGSAEVVVNQSRRGRESRERHVRGGVRRHRHGVDGHVEAAPLQLARGSEPGGPAADDGGPAAVVGESHFGGHPSRAPGERHARPAVAVVVDHRGFIEAVGPQQEPRRAVRPQPDGGADDAVRVHEHRCQP